MTQPLDRKEPDRETKVVVGMVFLSPLLRAASIRWWMMLVVLLGGTPARAEDAASDEGAEDPKMEDVTLLPELEVRGARVEEFGFRFNVEIRIPGTDTVIVSEVWPNTAASRAGLRPGDLILKVDGKKASVWSMGFRPNKIQERKWAELAAGKKSATLTLLVRASGAKEPHLVAMTIPSPAPRWGSLPWIPPTGRSPAVVPEAGPLAALARDVLDNGIWSLGEGGVSREGKRTPLLGYEWRIVAPSGTHRIWVTQQNGKTEIALKQSSRTTGGSSFFTSPSGALERGRGRTAKRKGEKSREFSAEEIRAAFEAEIDFWLHKVGRVTGRWPFELLPATTAAGGGSGETNTAAAENHAPRAESFLKLPAATAAQKELFFEALSKVGADAECWAYTETARGLDGDHVATVRIDPSLPPEEHTTLLKIDGKTPKKAQLEKWRTEGRGASPGLAELPPLSSVVETDDVRVVADETAAVVFELPVKATNEEFPAEKFRARFRVNKTHRGFEDFSVKLREAMSVAGVAKVTDAGLEARFQVFDPALAPQPVWLKLGGGVRVLLVKISRAFEVTRTDFKRVVPFEEPVPPAP